MGLIARKCFPNATRVIDRFHVQKISLEALQKSNTAGSHWSGKWSYWKNQEKQKKFEPYVLTNGDTLKQLRQKSLFPIQNKSKWSKTNRTSRSIIWIVSWYSKAYDLAQDWETSLKTTDKIIDLQNWQMAWKSINLDLELKPDLNHHLTQLWQ
jgi:hypothetical protein